MKLALFLGVAAQLLLQANAACPNACNGNGYCGQNDACYCYTGYSGADCSSRVCPHALAFVDAARGDLNHDGLVTTGDDVSSAYSKTQWSRYLQYEAWPSVAGTAVIVNDNVEAESVEGGGWKALPDEAHFYAECSGKGECDRNLGACRCFDGYTGGACQRSICPNDCSGHGVCRTISAIAEEGLNRKFVKSEGGHNFYTGSDAPFEYRLWDAEKLQACVCDVGYTGTDCSLRECPRGADPLSAVVAKCGATGCHNDLQGFVVTAGNYYIAFTTYEGNTIFTPDFTIGGVHADNAAGVKAALEALPGRAAGIVNVESITFGAAARIVVEFTTLTGNVPEFSVVPAKVDGGATPVAQPTNPIQLFTGVVTTGGASVTVTFSVEDNSNLRAGQLTGEGTLGGTTAADLRTAVVDAINDATGYRYENAAITTQYVTVTANGGGFDVVVVFGSKKFAQYPVKLSVIPTVGAAVDYYGESDVVDGTSEHAVCSDRGLCNYSTGTCTCFTGYVGNACSTQYALAM